jgi:hypothetical protein
MRHDMGYIIAGYQICKVHGYQEEIQATKEYVDEDIHD